MATDEEESGRYDDQRVETKNDTNIRLLQQQLMVVRALEVTYPPEEKRSHVCFSGFLPTLLRRCYRRGGFGGKYMLNYLRTLGFSTQLLEADADAAPGIGIRIPARASTQKHMSTS